MHLPKPAIAMDGVDRVQRRRLLSVTNDEISFTAGGRTAERRRIGVSFHRAKRRHQEEPHGEAPEQTGDEDSR